MDSTKSFVKVYNITPDVAEDFEFDFTVDSSDLLTELVPNLSLWGDIGWMELEEYEYSSHDNTMHFTLETKWEPPTRWLQQMSADTIYFENKLITMATIQQDETAVTGVAVMDGETLQEKFIFQMDAEEVANYYDDDKLEYELDDLDNQIWDSIGQFVGVCEKFYANGPVD
jgi:hypothetical protein